VLEKIENVKLFQELDIIKNQNVHGKKEKIIVKKENVVIHLECVLIKNVKLQKENVDGKENQFVKIGFMDVDGKLLEKQEEENIVVNI